MSPSQNLLRQHYHVVLGDNHLQFHHEKASQPPILVNTMDDRAQGLEEAGRSSSSSSGEGRCQGWLQLGLSSSSPTVNPLTNAPDQDRAQSLATVELNLFPEKPLLPMSTTNTTTRISSNITQRIPSPWGSTDLQKLHTMTSRSVLLPKKMVDYNSVRNFSGVISSSGDVGLRVISPPPSSRRQAGVWFMLRAAQNQGKEPFLPQIPKSYLRIKDKGMTVRLLMKYLANKLGLDDELEVEIACRGQQVPASWTLQQVRDDIWCCREVVMLRSDSPSMEHLMILEYSRRTEADIASLERI